MRVILHLSKVSISYHILASILLFTAVTQTALAQTDDENWSNQFGLPGVSGQVTAIAVSSNDVYVGGSFTTAGGVSASRIAKWDGSSWSSLENGTNERVYAISVSNNDVYVGGSFTTAGGVSASRIAKWDGSNWSALGSGMNGNISAIAISGSDVYVGGSFTTAGGVSTSRIAKWDGSNWSALGSGMNGNISAIAISGSDVYVGGSFTTAGGISANHIAKWDGSSWSALGDGVSGSVFTLAVNLGDVYVGGNFTTAGGVSASRIAKWDGSNWSALGSGMNSFVYAIAISGSDAYVGGSFTVAGGVSVNHIAKWDGSNWSVLGDGVNDNVSEIAINSNDVYVGGYFTTAGGVSASRIAKWDGTTWSHLGGGGGLDERVRSIAINGSDAYVGGNFTTVGELITRGIAKWDGSSWLALGEGVNGTVSVIAISGSDVYIGGFFTTAGGVSANNIAKWDGSSWLALGEGVNGYVFSIAISGSEIYVGGSFTTAGGVSVNHIAKWDGSNWSSLGVGVSDNVYTISISDNDIYVGGSFTTAGGVSVNHIAKWDGSNWSALGDGVSGNVYTIVNSNNDIYVGGAFNTASGVSAIGIARWDGFNWHVLGNGINQYVKAIAINGSNVYVGGYFTFADGVSTNYIAKWDGSNWSALGSGMNGRYAYTYVDAIAVNGSNVYVGGEFTSAGGKPSYNLGLWRSSQFTLIVNTNDDVDDGTCNDIHCSLREAINTANTHLDLDMIFFNIPGSGPHTIQPLSPLPTITDPVIIDGTTQQGFAGAPIIELDGSLIGEEVNGLEIIAGNSIIRGLVINQFGGSGIVLSGNGGSLIEGNYIGTDVNGSTALGNGWIGVSIFESSNNTVGGAAIGASIGVRNIISGNSFNGVQIEGAAATGNVVAGNYIGLAANGSDPLGNGGMGIRIFQAYGNTIGGPNPGEGNVVSDNGWAGPDFPWHGIHIGYCDATSSDDGNIIQGNYVGTDYTGMLGRGNDNYGILMFYSSYTKVIDNVVADNNYGVVVWGNDAEPEESPRPPADHNVITGNLIGTDATGTNALGNKLGLYIRRGHNNTVGGTSDELRNIISGNANWGLVIGRGGASGNNVWGNYIGLDINGEALGNGYGHPTSEGTGLEIIDATGNFIGGPNPGEANVISGNIGYGILIDRDVETTTDNFIQGNFIGTNPAGSEIIGNTKSGIKILDASNNQIGGADSGKGNLISGNGGYGIWLVGAESKYNKIFGNKIGTSTDGTEALPNTSDGVCVDWDDDDITIGAANNTEIYLNQIAYNGGNGVSIRHGEKNAITKNQIYLNDGLGIDLGSDSVTPNDLGDSDTGPNMLQNFPVLSNAYSAWGNNFSITTTVDISINSTPETQFSLQIFKNDECDPSGYGEGKTHILNKNITTDENGKGLIEELVINAQSGDYITATARDPQNNTSEFSQCIQAQWQMTTVATIITPTVIETFQAYIPIAFSSTTFSSQWPGSDVVMTLITPSGRVITRATSANDNDVEHENGLTYEYYTITDPEPGDWTIELFGADVPPGGEEVSLTVTVAPTEPMQTVTVDIKPEDENNTINCTDINGVIPVAILTTDEFDAMSIDHSTVRFGKYGSEAGETHVKNSTGEVKRHEEDVDNDGDIDLVFHFVYGETNLGCDDEFAVLTGSTYDGIFFTGADKIQSASNNKSTQSTGGNNAIPEKFALKQPYPNPFNPTTTINYALPKPSKVIITIYDISGRKVRELINNNESAGYKSIIWDGLDDQGKIVSGGIYIYHIKAGQYSSSKKLLFLK